MHLIALIIDVHQHPIPSAEADASCSSVARKTRHDIYKDQFHFEHIREQSGQACSRLVCMIMVPDLSKCIAALIRSGIIRICFLFTMSWNPQISRAGFWLCNAMICETLFCMDGLQKKESFWWSRTGSNRRPEACKATALPTELRPHFLSEPQTPAVASATLADAQTCAAAVRPCDACGIERPISRDLHKRPEGSQARLRAAHVCASARRPEALDGGPGRT